MADDPFGIGITPTGPEPPTLPGITVPPTTEPTVGETVAPPAPSPTPAPPEAPVEPAEPDQGKSGGKFDLIDLALMLVLLGIIALFVSLTGFFNWLIKQTLGRLFNAAGKPQLSEIQVGQSLSNTLGTQFAGLDAQFGIAFTELGQDIAGIGQAIYNAEQTLFQAVSKLANLEQSHVATRAKAVQQSGSADVQTTQATFGQAKTKQTADQGLKVADATQQQFQALVKHITEIIDPELEALRHRIPQLEKGHESIWDEIARHSDALGIAGVTAGVAAGLAQLGGTWIRCENTKAIGESLCGSNGNLLKDLLSGLIDIAALLDLCALVTLLYDVAESGPVQDILKELTGGIEALLQCRGLAAYDPPTVPAAPLPPALIGYPALAPVM